MSAVGTADDLHASASRITGLADFGPDDYTDGLGVLLESYARDAGLTPAGEKAARALLRGALMARLLDGNPPADYVGPVELVERASLQAPATSVRRAFTSLSAATR